MFKTSSEDHDKKRAPGSSAPTKNTRERAVLETAEITLENGFPGGGFLNARGEVKDVAAFSNHDGAQLVFIHRSINSRHPKSGIWKIVKSPINSK